MNYPYTYLPVISPIYRELKRWFNSRHYSGNKVYCPVCSRSFKSWLDGQSYGSCPYCQSETRHRLLCLYLESRYSPEKYPAKLLYFAPSWGQERWFKQKNNKFSCVTTDLSAPNVDFQSDITNLLFDDQSFDIVVCCHVLEHIPQDFKAIEEIFRVLSQGGTAFIQVPYAHNAKYTDEDPTVVDPTERTRRFGQFDHVRMYGQDIIDRLRVPGFNVELVNLAQNYTSEENMRLGLWDDTIFVCRKE